MSAIRGAAGSSYLAVIAARDMGHKSKRSYMGPELQVHSDAGKVVASGTGAGDQSPLISHSHV